MQVHGEHLMDVLAAMEVDLIYYHIHKVII
jgi:hypothetical protein